MKNNSLFVWAVSHLKTNGRGDYERCLRNNFLIWLMNLSGVKPSDMKSFNINYNANVWETEF